MIDGAPKVYYFTDRKKIAEEIKLPENNDFAPYMIIGPNKLGTGYKQIEYSKYKFWFNVHMTKDELKKMILAFNSAHSYALSRQKEYETYNDSNFCWKLITFLSMTSFIIAAIIFVYVRLYDSSFKMMKEALQVSFFFAILSVITAVMLTLVSCKSLPKFKDYHENLAIKLTKVIEHFNKKMEKKGMRIVPGKKFIWLELWKIRFIETHNRPIISLIGRDPIVEYDAKDIELILKAKDDELKTIYKVRYGTKYQKLSYLDEYYLHETTRKKKELAAADLLAKKEEEAKPRLSLIPEMSAKYEGSNPNFQGENGNSEPNMKKLSAEDPDEGTIDENDINQPSSDNFMLNDDQKSKVIDPKLPKGQSVPQRSRNDGKAAILNRRGSGKSDSNSANSINQIVPKIKDDQSEMSQGDSQRKIQKPHGPAAANEDPKTKPKKVEMKDKHPEKEGDWKLSKDAANKTQDEPAQPARQQPSTEPQKSIMKNAKKKPKFF